MEDSSNNQSQIAPGISTADLNNVFSSAKIVTNYSQAVQTAVPDIQNGELWALPIKADVSHAKANAAYWISSICPGITKEIPQSIIDFNQQFQTVYGTISNDLTQIQSQPNAIPTAAQKVDVDQSLNSLLDKITGLKSSAESLLSDISTFNVNLNNNQNQLNVDLNTVVGKFLNGASNVQTLTAMLNTNFLNCQVLGPCNSIVMIDFNINFKVVQTGADPDLISIIYTKTILETQIQNIQSAQTAAQLVLDTWTILNTKMASVIQDLNDTQDDGYANFIIQLDLDNAQQQWQQLAEYAQTLITNN